MFDERFKASSEHGRLYSLYEKIEAAIEFIAAMMFVLGSIFFFYPEWTYAGTWLFLIGSLGFAARPTIRFIREFHLSKLPVPGDDQ